MPDTAIGFGLDFLRSDDGTVGGNFSSVASVLDCTPPAVSRDVVDVTHTKSVEGIREFVGGLVDPGEAVIELLFDPSDANTAEFLADINSATPGYYKIQFPDATEWGFAALATGFEPGSPLDDKMTATFTVKLTGKPGFFA